MTLLEQIHKLREELHILVSGSLELQKTPIIELSERLDILINEYLLTEKNICDNAKNI